MALRNSLYIETQSKVIALLIFDLECRPLKWRNQNNFFLNMVYIKAWLSDDAQMQVWMENENLPKRHFKFFFYICLVLDFG